MEPYVQKHSVTVIQPSCRLLHIEIKLWEHMLRIAAEVKCFGLSAALSHPSSTGKWQDHLHRGLRARGRGFFDQLLRRGHLWFAIQYIWLSQKSSMKHHEAEKFGSCAVWLNMNFLEKENTTRRCFLIFLFSFMKESNPLDTISYNSISS